MYVLVGCPFRENQGAEVLLNPAPPAPLMPMGNANHPPLRCLDCTKIIPCSCPFDNRPALFPESTYQDAVNINKLGETFQSMWELVEQLPLEQLESLTRSFSKVVHHTVEAVDHPNGQQGGM